MKRFFAIFGILAIIAAGTFIAFTHFFSKEKEPICFREMIVFGDSLSDQGNVYIDSGEQFPQAPYFQGRFSNGKVWVEQLADLMNISDLRPSRIGGTNYAHGGARTGDGFRGTRPNIGEQIKEFLEENKTINPESLYIVCGGGNDFLGGTFLYTIENIERHIIDLANAGAKYFLIPNFAPLGYAPVFTHEIPILLEQSIVETLDEQIEKYLEYKMGKTLASMCKGFFPTLKSSMPQIKEYLPHVVEELSKRVANYMEDDPLTIDEITQLAFRGANAFSKMYNDHLRLVLDNLEREHDITIYRLDIHNVIQGISENPTMYGLLETYSPALDPKTHQLPEGVDPDNHLFFDGIHPTGSTHAIVATRAHALLHPPTQQ